MYTREEKSVKGKHQYSANAVALAKGPQLQCRRAEWYNRYGLGRHFGLGSKMDLRKRLERLGVHRGIIVGQTAQTRPPKASEPPLESLVDGTWVTSPGGRCFVAERLYPFDHRHGALSLSDILAMSAEEWSQFTAGLGGQGLDPRQAVFLDVETTGMAWGTGTYAFLVGLGFFQEGGFLLRQYFMPDYADEEALLDLVAASLAGCGHLITFNGRSFDWPILEARYVLAQREPPCHGATNLDLLLWSRRLWRRSLPSCALSALETAVLSVAREGCDVPGFLIPELYQDYVRYGRTRPMQRVFYHNAMDLLSMVVLAARIGQALLSPSRREPDPLCDYLSLGAFYERIGWMEEAICAYQVATEGDSRRQEALKQLAFLFKRVGRYDEAVHIWETCLDGDELYPYIELAKHFEHRLRDYEEAKRIIHEALAWLNARHHLLHRSEYRRVTIDLEHRLKRVEKHIISSVGQDNSPGGKLGGPSLG